MPKSKYIGVYWSNTSNKWYSRVKYNYKSIYLGVFDTEEEAAKAYDDKVFELRGDNAKFNFRSNIHMCEADNCSNIAVTKYNGLWVCIKHKSQLRANGKFASRTIYDKNEIIEENDYAYIMLYDKNSNTVAKTKIDIECVDLVKNCNGI